MLKHLLPFQICECEVASTIAPEENCPLVRVRVVVRVNFMVGGNCPRIAHGIYEKLLPTSCQMKRKVYFLSCGPGEKEVLSQEHFHHFN